MPLWPPTSATYTLAMPYIIYIAPMHGSYIFNATDYVHVAHTKST